ncbi:MAG: hypothetical protein EHM23_03385 [Acidobacteria bacterium]|nr:MAG: hypothetical protein EHM23_03385 [Acidobacteriota bacterium]
MDRPKRVLIHGWTGNKNLGDEAILAGLLRGSEGRWEVAAVSDDPGWTTRYHRIPAVRRIPRFTLKGICSAPARLGRIGRYVQAVRGSDLCLLGGGDMFLTESNARDWCQELLVPEWLGRRTGIVGVTAGNLPDAAARLVRNRMIKASFVTARDQNSLCLLRGIAPKSRTELAADLALLLSPLSSRPQQHSELDRCAVILRRWPELESRIDEALRFLVAKCKTRFDLLPMQKISFCDDELYSREVVARIPELHSFRFQADLDAFRHHLSAYPVVISTRLHGVLLAAIEGIPAIGISLSPKIEAFQRELGLPELVVDPAALTPTLLAEKWDWLAANYNRITARLRSSLPGLVDRAKRNSALIAEALGLSEERAGSRVAPAADLPESTS